MEYLGNKALLDYTKTGFLASKHIDVSDVMACYEWASRRVEPNTCVMGGFSSKMEKDVLHFLIKTRTPIIWVLARKPYKELPSELQKVLAEDRLLVISISKASRQSKENAFRRNEYIASTAERLIFTGVTETSSLFSLYHKYKEKVMPL